MLKGKTKKNKFLKKKTRKNEIKPRGLPEGAADLLRGPAEKII